MEPSYVQRSSNLPGVQSACGPFLPSWPVSSYSLAQWRSCLFRQHIGNLRRSHLCLYYWQSVALSKASGTASGQFLPHKEEKERKFMSFLVLINFFNMWDTGGVRPWAIDVSTISGG